MANEKEIPLEPIEKSRVRQLYVLNAHTLTQDINKWTTRSGKIVEDDENVHTVKFNGWYRAVDPENNDYTSDTSVLGHMTVKWGRYNSAFYDDYRPNGFKGVVELPRNFKDRRTHIVSNIESKAYYHLNIKGHKPSEHAKKLVSRKTNDNKFKFNVRYAMRVRVTTNEFNQLNKLLVAKEKEKNFGMFGEMDSVEHPMTRCFTPIELLARIKDPQFAFSNDAVTPHDFMHEFSNYFQDVTSNIVRRTYSKDISGFRHRVNLLDEPNVKRPRINVGGI